MIEALFDKTTEYLFPKLCSEMLQAMDEVQQAQDQPIWLVIVYISCMGQYKSTYMYTYKFSKLQYLLKTHDLCTTYNFSSAHLIKYVNIYTKLVRILYVHGGCLNFPLKFLTLQ